LFFSDTINSQPHDADGEQELGEPALLAGGHHQRGVQGPGHVGERKSAKMACGAPSGGPMFDMARTT